MKLKYLSVGVAFALSTASAGAQTQAPEGGDKVLREPLTLTGCVTAGTKANTFLLSNVQRTDAPAVVSADTTVYWLTSPDKLKGHAGHQVEIEGILEDDVDKSAMKKGADGKVELTTERESRKVEVAEDSAAGDAVKSVGTTGQVLSYKVKVKSIKMLSASCPQ
jgi:hypothetical protein